MFSSMAQVNYIMPQDCCFYRSRLTAPEQLLYDEICRAVSGLKTQISMRRTGEFDFSKIVYAILMDQPMLFYLSGTGFTVSFNESTVRASWSFLSDTDTICSLRAKADRRLSLLKLPSCGTALERELYVHNLYQRMKLKTGFEQEWYGHCIIGPLLYGQTVCGGAAHLFHLLCSMCGVVCIYLRGTASNPMISGPHAWNMVRLKDQYAHVDAYWDCLARLSSMESFCYTYLNLSDSQIRRSHVCEEQDLPSCPQEKYSYFVMNHLEAHTAADYRALLRAAVYRGRKDIMVRLDDGLLPEDCIRETERVLRWRLSGGYVYSFDEYQRVLIIHRT